MYEKNKSPPIAAKGTNIAAGISAYKLLFTSCKPRIIPNENANPKKIAKKKPSHVFLGEIFGLNGLLIHFLPNSFPPTKPPISLIDGAEQTNKASSHLNINEI
ncbi:UNVERIFIED_CONTAM: hypothetical protein O8I53_07565 [Campylobacter lari]